MLFWTILLALPLVRSLRNEQSFSGGLEGVEIAPKVLSNVPYGNSRLSVWGHLDNPNRKPDKKKYFVMPVVMLLPKTATCHTNIFTGDTTLQFKLVMWNEDVASAVLIHLREATSNPLLQSLQITTLPMQQIRLVWENSAQQLAVDFEFNTKWKSYANQDNILRFDLVVSTKKLCEKALVQMQARPHSLGSLELQYVLHGARAFRKRITIASPHLIETKMYEKMRNKLDPNGNVYLNSGDLKKFAGEVIRTFVTNNMKDSDYIDTGDTISLSKILFENLSKFKQSTTTMTPKMWQSTIWQADEFTRPDKLTDYLNKVITKDQTQSQTVHIDDKKVQKESNISLSSLLKAAASGGGKNVQQTRVSEDKLKKWLTEQNYDVEWTGEKFQVKPTDLYRLNPQQLAQKQHILSTYMQVHQVQFTYNVKVSFPDDASNDETQVATAAINERLDRVEKLVNGKIDALNTNVNANAETLTSLQLLRTGKICEYFLSSTKTWTCSANREIGYCVCFIYDKNYIYNPTINGAECNCPSGAPRGACCLSVV